MSALIKAVKGMRVKLSGQTTSFPYPSATKPIEELTIHEKLMKIGRHMPCSQKVPTSTRGVCDCLGWQPNVSPINGSPINGRLDSCVCGHRLSSHVGVQDADFDRRLDVAMKIDQYLDEKQALLDFSYDDAHLKKLREEMTLMSRAGQTRKREEEDDTDYVNGLGSDPDQSVAIREGKRIKKDSDDNEGEGADEEGESSNNVAKNIPDLDLPEGLPEDLEFRIVTNNNTRDSLILLTNLKNVFATQLPNMPKQYITRLTYDYHHTSVVLVRPSHTGSKIPKVVGGITYRPFVKQKFAEIVFCAIDAQEQVRGHGSRLMNYFKDYIRATTDIQHFMTYADDLAIGFFKKNGFTTEIDLDPSVWVGYIKDYTGGTLMQV